MAKKNMQTKLVKKRPTLKTLSHKQIKTTIYIKSDTPYVSGLKRIKKFLHDCPRNGAKYITVLGMGKAVERTLALACYFSEDKGNKVQILTRTAVVLDEVTNAEQVEEISAESKEEKAAVESDDEDANTYLKKRSLSGVEVRIYPL